MARRAAHYRVVISATCTATTRKHKQHDSSISGHARDSLDSINFALKYNGVGARPISATCVLWRPGAMSSKFIIDSMLPKYHQQFQHQNLFPTNSLPSAVVSDVTSGLAVNYSSTTSSPASSSSPNSNASSPSSRMYPYVSAAAHHHHQQQQAAAAAAFGAAAASAGTMVPAAFSSSAASSAALAAAAAVDAAAADKSCRYTAGLGANVPPTDSMVNYTLGHHHQNGAAASAVSAAASSVSAASASMAVAAQFYHQAASAVVDPLNSCSQPGAAAAGQPLPDIPRYPWMSITGQ